MIGDEQSLLNGQGTRMGGAYSAVRYILGDTLKSGVERIAALRYNIPDLRMLLEGDMRFLRQF